ncbi:MAG: hypothetical protein EBR82_63520 [Caulobacteraceae bacterium]|nr:hypothetical protein [Caulobacteraceae bacterium]
MIDIHVSGEGLYFLLRFLPRELDDILERVDWAIAEDDPEREKGLIAEENACRQLLEECRHAERLLQRRLLTQKGRVSDGR